MRLLFSSAQVEYIRYWLHAVGLTKQPIPIPSSEYLILPSDLVSCSPDVYAEAAVLKKAIKVRHRSAAARRRNRARGRRGGRKRRRRRAASPNEHAAGGLCANDGMANTDSRTCCSQQNVDKNNKRLRGTGTLLTSRRFAFEKARTLWAAKLGTWCAIDFEAWDMDHTLLTEFGWSLASWKDGILVRENGHLIVKEYRSYMQKYVPNHREVCRIST